MRKALIAVGVVAALAGGGAAIAAATGGDDDAGENDKAITGSALDKASAAALKSTGGGEVSDTEVGDEEGAYEVEVTRPDGSQVDVHLDKGFHVIGQQADEENEQNDD